jgi:hypothetical protein
MSLDIQGNIIETIKIIAGEKLKNVNFTKSYTGIIRSISEDRKRAMVDIFGSELECVIPHNLAWLVDIEDIIIVQDIANNKVKRIVQGVINSLNKVMFHIYDPIEDRIVSSVLQLWDEETQMPIEAMLELE